MSVTLHHECRVAYLHGNSANSTGVCLSSTSVCLSKFFGLLWQVVTSQLCRSSRVYSSVPEYWGKESPYTGGTGFLGTPQDHREVQMFVLLFLVFPNR